MKKILFVMVMFSTIILTACSTATTITPLKAKEMMENDRSVVLVDVRTLEEYNNERIPGAILVPLDNIKSEALKKLVDKNVTYIIYCRSGNRSATALKILKEMGYKSLYDLGGIINWPYDKVSG